VFCSSIVFSFFHDADGVNSRGKAAIHSTSSVSLRDPPSPQGEGFWLPLDRCQINPSNPATCAADLTPKSFYRPMVRAEACDFPL
jgi:hypothetical protein